MSEAIQWVKDGVGWKNASHELRAYVKWDGCSHLWFPEQVELHIDGCYHHICDLDEFIAVLQALRKQVAEEFDTAYREHEEYCLPFHREPDEESEQRAREIRVAHFAQLGVAEEDIEQVSMIGYDSGVYTITLRDGRTWKKAEEGNNQ